jgi:hypothetical protein
MAYSDFKQNLLGLAQIEGIFRTYSRKDSKAIYKTEKTKLFGNFQKIIDD